MNYPKDSHIIQDITNIIDHKLHAQMDEEMKATMKELGGLLTRAIPLFDRYRLYIESLEVTKADLQKKYPDYDRFPSQFTNKIERAKVKAEKQRKADLLCMSQIIDTQARHLNNVTDEEYEQIEAFAESI